MLKVRFRWLVVLMLALSLLLAACGEVEDEPVEGETGVVEEEVVEEEPEVVEEEPVEEVVEEEPLEEEVVEEEAAAGDGTELTLLGWASSEAEDVRLNEVIAGFNEANPEYTAVFNPVPEYDAALQTALAGTPPDLFYVNADAFPNLASQGALAPVGDIVIEPEDFYDPMLQAFTWEGELLAVPKDFSVLALIYNTEMLAEAGIEAPPANWEELRASLETLTAAGLPPACIDSTIDRWGVFALQAGGNFLSEDRRVAQFTSEPVVEGLTFYTDLVADGLALPPGQLDSGWCGEALGKGVASMTIEGNWIVPFLADSFPDVQWEAAPLPEGPAGPGTWAFTAGYGFNPRSPNPEASAELLAYLTSPEGMAEWTGLGLAMPTRESLAEGWAEQFPELGAFISSAEFATVRPSAVGFPDVIRELQAQVEGVIGGTQTAEGALEEVQLIAEDTLAEE